MTKPQSIRLTKEIIIFCNPRSGRFKPAKFARLVSGFESVLGACRVVTETADLRELRHCHIIAVGGDGTFHLAINHSDIQSNTYSVIPMGSGNDFASAFEPRDTGSLANAIANETTQKADLIKVGKILAHTVAGIGFDAFVSQKANESKNTIPALKFIIPVARYMFGYKARNISITAEGYTFNGDSFMLSFGNGKRAGGGFRLFPKAEMNDGLFDMLLIRKPAWYQKLLYVWLVNFGKHLNLSVVDYRQFKSLHVETPDQTLLNADGEVYETGSFDAEILPGAIRVIM